MPEFNVHPSIIVSMQEMIDNGCLIEVGLPYTDMIPVVQNEDTNITNQTAEQENTMPIFHFYNEYKKAGETFTFRTITNFFVNEEEKKAYFQSFNAKAPVNGVFALLSGAYIPRLLIERLVNKGKNFRVTVVKNSELVAMGINMRKKIEENTMAWSSASYTFFLKVEDEVEFGLSALGMKVAFKKKTSKRLQEVCRFSAHSLYMAGDEVFWTKHRLLDGLHMEQYGRPMGANLVFAEFENCGRMLGMGNDEESKLYDGMNFISPRLAKMLGFNGKRGIFRAVTRNGVIKGDFITSEFIKADLVYHTENLKAELCVDTEIDGDWVLITVENHEPVHIAAYDVQSVTNNPTALDGMTHLSDLERMVADLKDIVANGTLPGWMQKIEKAHDEGLGWIEMEQMSDVMAKGHERWVMGYGMDFYASQNYTYMGVTAGIKKMQTGLDIRSGLFKKTFIPMSNAGSFGVVTVSALTIMGGFDLSEFDTQRVNFIEGVGAVIPDHRFLDTFDLHGTWDQDDTMKLALVRIWSSARTAITNLREDNVLDSQFEIPRNEEDAIIAAIGIRSPNGPGEYSIEFLGDFAAMENVTETLPVINLATLPRGQKHLLAQVKMTGLPDDTVDYAPVMTRDHALYMMEAQAENPGIGALANAMMVWVDVMGVSFPPVMAQVFGEMVDAVQQGFCKEQLEAVKQESTRVFAQLFEAMENDPSLTVDRDMLLTRVPPKQQANINPAQVTSDTRLTQINARYTMAINELTELAKTETMIRRNESTLAKLVRELNIPADIMESVASFVRFHEGNLKDIDKKNDTRRVENPFEKMMKNHVKVTETKAYVDHMISIIESIEDETVRARVAVGLYKYMVTATPKRPLGQFDRILFQEGNNGALMDIMVHFLRKFGKV